MSRNRLQIQQLLEKLQIAVGETPHVYYQPPETVKMVYPCFVYNWDDSSTTYANDKPYVNRDSYSVTYITREVEPILAEGMKRIPKSRFIRHFTSENLHHFVFTISGHLNMEEFSLDL